MGEKVSYDGLIADEEPNVLSDERRELSERVARLAGWTQDAKEPWRWYHPTSASSDPLPDFDSDEMQGWMRRDCEARGWDLAAWGSAVAGETPMAKVRGFAGHGDTYAEAFARAYCAAREATDAR